MKDDVMPITLIFKVLLLDALEEAGGIGQGDVRFIVKNSWEWNHGETCIQIRNVIRTVHNLLGHKFRCHSWCKFPHSVQYVAQTFSSVDERRVNCRGFHILLGIINTQLVVQSEHETSNSELCGTISAGKRERDFTTKRRDSHNVAAFLFNHRLKKSPDRLKQCAVISALFSGS